MTQPDFDVIVVGAGAGGAAAAYFLRRAGVRVLVIEKAPWPRDKPCGGAIPRPALERFPFDLTSVVRAAPTSVRLTHAGLSPVDVPLPDQPVVMVRRRDFDAFLLAQADAEVLQRQAVTGVTEADDHVRVEVGKGRLIARHVVGADGATSVVARNLGLRLRRRLGGALEAEVPLDDRAALQVECGSRAAFFLREMPRGYGWIFPRGDCVSVGIVRFRPGRTDLRSVLYQEMTRLGIHLAGIELRGHPIPYYQAPSWPFWQSRSQETLSTRRCLLVGDAAGLVDPLLGEGIRHAIVSAQLAAEAIIRDDLSGYGGMVWQKIGHSLATAGLVADLYYRWPRACYRLGVRNPAMLHQFVDVLTERRSYQGIGRRLLVSTARWLLEGAKGRR